MPSNREGKQKSLVARLRKIVYLLFDGLEFLFAPKAMLRSIEEEFDQKNHSDD